MTEKRFPTAETREVLILRGIGHETSDAISEEYATVKEQEVYGVLDGNANDLSDLWTDVQPANSGDGHHSAVPLLRPGRGGYPAYVGAAGLFSGSGGGVSGALPRAATNRGAGHGADPDYGADRGHLRAMDAHLGLRAKLANLSWHPARCNFERPTENPER